MNFLTGTLESGLFALASLMRLPVMLALCFCVAWALFLEGQFLAQFLIRRRQRQGFNIEKWLENTSLEQLKESALNNNLVLPITLQRFSESVFERIYKLKDFPEVEVGYLTQVYEEGLKHTLDSPRLLIRVGPSLGLLGTLIPMGSALASLSAGNLEGMASQMVVAFSTTIIGLGCGTLAYGTAVIQERWAREEIRELHYLGEWILNELCKNRSSPSS
ncbi:MAG: MotA/TolQ/ExbB proton channel family protein [Candidatus Brocadiales bacterium]